jgi:hypothetical protein
MLSVEQLEARCLPSQFITLPGFPDSLTGWAPSPGVGTKVDVYFGALRGPAAAATRAAVASLDQQFRHAGVGVDLVAVRSRAQAKVLILRGPGGGSEGGEADFAPLIPAGTAANGHPYFRWFGRIKIVMSTAMPWYYGAAPTPPRVQADFETAVMHELGHSLGLDHNPARNDPANQDGYDTMNPVLPTGVARRHFGDDDLRALQEVYGHVFPR